MLFGDLNFALVPQTNAAPHLYVFTTKMENATLLVRVPGTVRAKHVPNELLVKLKPGVNPDALAKLYGAKVVGRLDKLGIYRLQFADAASADAALNQLQNNTDVSDADYNYYFDPPPSAQALASASLPPVNLQLNPPGSSGKVIVGLVDTPVQSLDGSLNQFLLKQLSVAGDASAEQQRYHARNGHGGNDLARDGYRGAGRHVRANFAGGRLRFQRNHDDLERRPRHPGGGQWGRHRFEFEPRQFR